MNMGVDIEKILDDLSDLGDARKTRRGWLVMASYHSAASNPLAHAILSVP